jgi:Mg/Co/Ni transporter MgtE
MKTAGELVSERVVVGFPEQRLAYLSDAIQRTRAQYCAILDPGSARLVGVVDFSALAGTPTMTQRIFADLMKPPPEHVVRTTAPASEVDAIFARHGLGEITVVDQRYEFVGLITPDSYCQALMARLPRAAT